MKNVRYFCYIKYNVGRKEGKIMKKFIIPVLLTSAVLLSGCQKQVDYVTFHGEAEKAKAEREKVAFETATFDVSGYILNSKQEKDNYTVHWFYNYVDGVPIRDAEKSTSTYVTMEERAVVDVAILAVMFVKADLINEDAGVDYFVGPLATKQKDGSVGSTAFDQYGNLVELYTVDSSIKMDLKASYTFK